MESKEESDIVVVVGRKLSKESLYYRTISTISNVDVHETVVSDPSLLENTIILDLFVDSCNNRIMAALHALGPFPLFNALAHRL
ncbi:hypothetical protein VNO80_07450 [Phaseolus coccineus]|uniref:Uncharacterized protein n=1 Tax=Phaseolus coccineus TaxID=3886 RepID=A0AAN9RJX4_PHACN